MSLDHELLSMKVRAIDEADFRLSDWEMEFVSGLLNHRKFSQKQADVIEKIYKNAGSPSITIIKKKEKQKQEVFPDGLEDDMEIATRWVDHWALQSACIPHPSESDKKERRAIRAFQRLLEELRDFRKSSK